MGRGHAVVHLLWQGEIETSFVQAASVALVCGCDLGGLRGSRPAGPWTCGGSLHEGHGYFLGCSEGSAHGGNCAAASWSVPCTFARFYRLNVASPLSVGATVLYAAGQRGGVGTGSPVPRDPVGRSHPL